MSERDYATRAKPLLAAARNPIRLSTPLACRLLPKWGGLQLSARGLARGTLRSRIDSRERWTSPVLATAPFGLPFTGDVLAAEMPTALPATCTVRWRKLGAVQARRSLYLIKEGRGNRLAQNARISLQDQGFDTVEAHHRLGFEDDEREFSLGAEGDP